MAFAACGHERRGTAYFFFPNVLCYRRNVRPGVAQAWQMVIFTLASFRKFTVYEMIMGVAISSLVPPSVRNVHLKPAKLEHPLCPAGICYEYILGRLLERYYHANFGSVAIAGYLHSRSVTKRDGSCYDRRAPATGRSDRCPKEGTFVTQQSGHDHPVPSPQATVVSSIHVFSVQHREGNNLSNFCQIGSQYDIFDELQMSSALGHPCAMEALNHCILTPDENIMSQYTHIINGKPVTSQTTLDVQNPATQKKIAEVPVASKEQLDEAVAAARAALPSWSAKSQDERAQVLEQIAGTIEKNIPEYKQILVSEQGKTLANAEWELGGAILWLRETAKLRLPEKVIVDNEQTRITERRVPIGVVSPASVNKAPILGLMCLDMISVNFPLALCIWKLGPALLAGNTLVLKPSPFTPLTTLRFVKDIQAVVPAGVVNILSGDDNLGPWITSHPGIDKVSFTGSSETGKKVMASASTSLKRLTLELGGNDPAIILPDVDVAKVVPDVFWAALFVSLAHCSAAKRLYVHEKIYDQFREELAKFAKTVKTGNGADPESQLGPVQNLMQYKKVLSFFEDVKANGYKFLTGGDVNPNPTDGLFIPVSFVDNPPEESKIVREEPFGVRARKKTQRTNVPLDDTNLGLSASVWGKDLEAVERIAKQIQAGTVCMNELGPATPFSAFGGHKESGIGVENGMNGLLTYSNIQTFTLKKQVAFA
ncbi:aldehyde dehydrogenase, putative [Rhizoctonia solani AG-1 IA]|uniref:Aldehyde dehydrogenase, putative n=1 Tax=Thanatephorus cucumeris (strain AG1-IA) TaxID=983506 RepID=L8WW46_THACA|nr:aldehyde dehydrogenase, putative [Rhizoctonia solani AG-1 IA]